MSTQLHPNINADEINVVFPMRYGVKKDLDLLSHCESECATFIYMLL